MPDRQVRHAAATRPKRGHDNAFLTCTLFLCGPAFTFYGLHLMGTPRLDADTTAMLPPAVGEAS